MTLGSMLHYTQRLYGLVSDKLSSYFTVSFISINKLGLYQKKKKESAVLFHSRNVSTKASLLILSDIFTISYPLT